MLVGVFVRRLLGFVSSCVAGVSGLGRCTLRCGGIGPLEGGIGTYSVAGDYRLAHSGGFSCQ